MLVFAMLAHEQGTFAASSDANKFCPKCVQDPLRCGLLILKRKTQQLNDSWEFVAVQLDDVRLLRGISENLRGVKRLAEIDVENASGLWPDSFQERMNGLSRFRRALGKGAETDRVRFLGQRLPHGGPFQKIPRHRLCDLKSGLALCVKFYLRDSRAIGWIGLDAGGVEPESLEPASGLEPEFVASDAAGDDPFIAQEACHVSKVRRRTAKLAAIRKNIPEQLAKSDRRELSHGRAAQGFVFWLCSSWPANLSSRSASSFFPKSRYACPNR